MDKLSENAAFWNRLAEHDPLWAILSAPDRRGNKWDLETFLSTGEREVSLLMHQLDALPGGGPSRRDRALDFGCGVGRLTQALAQRFAHVTGVDVSRRMIDLARHANRHGARVDYVLNERSDLTTLDGTRFDLIYTDLVLQHMAPKLATRYVSDMLGLIAPGGMLVFQLPSRRRSVPSSLPAPMEDAAYDAAIDVVEGRHSTDPSSLVLRVTNVSRCDWRQDISGAIRLGNHWLNSKGEMLVQDDGRVALPRMLSAGASAVVSLEISAPPPGGSILELDLVHEGVTWFGDKGSPTVKLVAPESPTLRPTVLVASPPPIPSETAASLRGTGLPDDEAVEFPMNGVPREEIEALIAGAGHRLVLAEPDERGGPEWEGFRYFVRHD